MTIHDITLPLSAELAYWPGDTRFHREWNARIEDGSPVNLSAITLSAHLGTHADAPFHYEAAGQTMEAVCPEVYLGAALLLDVSGKDKISVDDLRERNIRRAPRLLLRTGAWIDHTRFPERIPTLEPEVPAYLSAQGVRLLGLDLPSVDELDSKELTIHHALHAQGIYILESLALANVPEGLYELIALPLRLTGSDGSPVRAILRTLSPSSLENET